MSRRPRRRRRSRRFGVFAAAAPPRCGWQRVRRQTHRDPPSCAPVLRRGGLVGGSIQAVGRVTGALLSAAGKTTHPPPLPLREGAVPTLRPPVGGNEEVQAEGGSLSSQDTVSGGSAFSCNLGAHHGNRPSRATQRASGRPGPARDRRRPRRRRQQGGADRHQQQQARPRREPRGRADRDPVDALGQAGRERGRSTWARAATSTSSAGCATTTTRTPTAARSTACPSPARRSTTSTARPRRRRGARRRAAKQRPSRPSRLQRGQAERSQSPQVKRARRRRRRHPLLKLQRDREAFPFFVIHLEETT